MTTRVPNGKPPKRLRIDPTGRALDQLNHSGNIVSQSIVAVRNAEAFAQSFLHSTPKGVAYQGTIN